MRWLLSLVLATLSLLTANSAYLSGVRGLEWLSRIRGAERLYQNQFYLWMVLVHLLVGVLLIIPFVAFGVRHLILARRHHNRKAVLLGYAFFSTGLIVLLTGLLLVRTGLADLKHPLARSTVFWLHVVAPVVAGVLYAWHRLSGPAVRWRVGAAHGGVVVVAVSAMAVLHPQQRQQSTAPGETPVVADFHPSLARTSTGKTMPSELLMMDDYCRRCHPDAYTGWAHSAHRLSSFNNPMYLASVRETRAVVHKRDGTVAASRWCAGCHDPVPLLTGAFDDPEFDDVNHPAAHAGITCTTCHMITAVNSPRGNADYTIEPAVHYPFTGSSSRLLQYVNEQLIKAKPSFHKQTFLKPLHKTSEFCSTCHKVHLPHELTHYREFVRGQNHFDSFHLSGASGHGARSSYFPMRASENCGTCHMPLTPSEDFGARPMPRGGPLGIHDHLFPGANTALPFLHGWDDVVARQQEFLRTAARVDLVGIRLGDRLDSDVVAPLREPILLKEPNRREHELAFSQFREQNLPVLQPGGDYLFDVVIRNLRTGHILTQGTADSNELWLDVRVTAGDRVIGRSGALDERRRVDDWSYFVNAYVLDRNGERIARRNPQDIFTVLYNHQVNPGSADVVHYALHVPDDVSDLITVEVKLQYRKFDSEFMEFVTETAKPGDPPIAGHSPGAPYINTLPITTVASDSITFPVAGVETQPPLQEFKITVDHAYQRWQDYGIALMNEGARQLSTEEAGAELRLAEQVLLDAEQRFGYVDIRLHLVQLYLMQGRTEEAAAALARAEAVQKPLFFTEPVYAPWAIAWNRALVERQQGRLDSAADSFRSVLESTNDQIRDHGFDFSQDYVVINELAQTLMELASHESPAESESRHMELLHEAAGLFQQTLQIDPENVMAHHNLAIIHAQLGNADQAADHRALHARYKSDDNARDIAVHPARLRDPAANHASERVSIYSLNRPGAVERESSPVASASETPQ